MTQAFPLNWPFGKPRTSHPARSKFGARSVEGSRQILLKQLRLLGGKDLILSTNIKLRLDGAPYSNQTPPVDKGVSVYFKWKGNQMCFACDRWDRIEDNIYAVAMTIDALRGIERWGSGDMVQQAFTGFVALPAPERPEDVLGVRAGATQDEIEAAFRKKLFSAHPDHGGSNDAMQRLQDARRKLLA